MNLKSENDEVILIHYKIEHKKRVLQMAKIGLEG